MYNFMSVPSCRVFCHSCRGHLLVLKLRLCDSGLILLYHLQCHVLLLAWYIRVWTKPIRFDMAFLPQTYTVSNVVSTRLRASFYNTRSCIYCIRLFKTFHGLPVRAHRIDFIIANLPYNILSSGHPALTCANFNLSLPTFSLTAFTSASLNCPCCNSVDFYGVFSFHALERHPRTLR